MDVWVVHIIGAAAEYNRAFVVGIVVVVEKDKIGFSKLSSFNFVVVMVMLT